jgi:XTP/dITP diphosphohydrolase
MKKLIFATRNLGKLKEITEMLGSLGMKVMSAEQAGVHEDIEEDQDTFEANAIKKARFVAEKTGEWAVADDSGVCIRVLNGRPGVHTARWAGPNTGDEGLINYTLDQLKNISEEKRQASFYSVAALVAPTGEFYTFEGVVHGVITTERRGTHHKGMPYDEIFQPDGYEHTFAEMNPEQKNILSHRGHAFAQLKAFLEQMT